MRRFKLQTTGWTTSTRFSCVSFFYLVAMTRDRDFKNSGKYGSGLSCRWILFTAWSFVFKLHLISHRVEFKKTELGTLEWWISGLMLNPLFFLISRLNIACFPHEFNLLISYSKVFSSELETLEWDLLNPDQLINLETKNKRRTSHV